MSKNLAIMIKAINMVADVAELDAIIETANDRKRSLARQTICRLRPGDEVTFSDHIRPRYMVGLKAKVRSLNRESVTVDCPPEPAYGRFSGHRNVRVPLVCIVSEAT